MTPYLKIRNLYTIFSKSVLTLFAVVLLTTLTHGQQSFVTTFPPLINNNVASGITFEVEANTPVIITGIDNIFGSGTLSGAEVWYRNGGVQHVIGSSPSVSTANGWTQLWTGTVVGNSSTPMPIPNWNNLAIQANQRVGIAIFGVSTYYQTWVGALDQFTDSTLTVFTGQNIGYGGGGIWPNHPRQFLGTVYYQIIGPCTSPPTIDSLIASNTAPCKGELVSITAFSSSFGLGSSIRWQSSKTGSNGPWINNNSDTLRTISFTDTTEVWYRAYEICSGVADTSAPIHISYPPRMSGFYTLNSLQATGGNNYQTLQEFINDLTCFRVGGFIVLDIAPGQSFTGGVEFKNIVGLSDSNFIQINGNGATIVTNNVAPLDSFILRFSNVSNITLSGLQVVNTLNNNPIFGIFLSDSCKKITVENCLIDVGTDNTAWLSAAIVSSSSATSVTEAGSNAQYLTIKNNEIVGGNYGICLNGNSGYQDNYGHHIENNVVRDFFRYGIYLSHADSTNVFNNDISRNTRLTLSTFYGFYMETSRNIKVHSNKIHDTGIGSFTSYPFYITTSVNSAGFESEFINNLVYNIQGTSTIYGMYFLGTRDHIRIYHNTIDLDLPQNSTGTIRAMFASGAPNNHDFRNNIFSIRGGGSGTKHNMFFSSTSTSLTSNNNVLYNASTGGFSNFTGRWSGTSLLSLNDWTNATALDSNSAASNPYFVNTAAGNLMPLSPIIDNLGAAVNVTFDIDSLTRSNTSPDVGAFEFTTSFTSDLTLKNLSAKWDTCLNSPDTLLIEIENSLGSTRNFSFDSLEIVWDVKGPLNYRDSFMITSDTLAVGESKTFAHTNFNLDVPGLHTIRAWIKPSSINQFQLNDTLPQPLEIEVLPLLSVLERHVIIDNNTDPALIQGPSIFNKPKIYISEICHARFSTTGVPIGGWPSWLIADDYIEITGPPGFDLVGYTLEHWGSHPYTPNSHTFPKGTILGPNGTAIIAVGGFVNGQSSPQNYFYNVLYSSIDRSPTASVGITLLDSEQNITDAVGYNNYTFPTAANVPVSEWSHSNSQVISHSAGIRLIGPDDNTDNNWVVVNNTLYRQDPNHLNSGLSLNPINGYYWSFNNTVLDSTLSMYVGPFSNSGRHEYVLNYNSPCGLVSDTAFVTVALPFSIDSTKFPDNCKKSFQKKFAIYPGSTGLQPYSYIWNNGDTTQLIDSLDAGYYSVTVFDAEGIQQQTRDFTVEESMEYSVAIDTALCFGRNGRVEVKVNSGAPLVSILWNTGFQNTVYWLPQGIYSFAAEDALGCVFKDTLEVVTPTELTSSNIVFSPTCQNDQDGEITVNVSGGLPPYKYFWGSSLDSTYLLTNLAAGSYNLIVSDANNCNHFSSFTLLNPGPLDTLVTVEGNRLTANQSNAFYQWFDCNTGADIPAAQGRLYVTGVSGFFGVKISVDRCTLSSDCYQVIMANVDELDNESKWVVFPNPNNGNFTVQSTKSTQLILINALGQTVESVRLNTSNQYSSELSGLSSGIYFLIDAENPNNQRKKIVVY